MKTVIRSVFIPQKQSILKKSKGSTGSGSFAYVRAKRDGSFVQTKTQKNRPFVFQGNGSSVLGKHKRTAPLCPRYLISCSRALNSGVEKNSPKVISRPSQSFLMVATVALLFLLLVILLMVDWDTPLIVPSLLMEIPRFWHNSMIRFATAVPESISTTSILLLRI